MYMYMYIRKSLNKVPTLCRIYFRAFTNNFHAVFGRCSEQFFSLLQSCKLCITYIAPLVLLTYIMKNLFGTFCSFDECLVVIKS